MPEHAPPPLVEDDLMYSSVPPPHTMCWLTQRSLDALGRLLFGALICAVAFGTIFVFVYSLFYGTGWLFHLLSLPWPFH
jgi:hypothetical protein